MAVQLGAEEKMLIDMVRDLVRERVAPRAAEVDATGEFPWDIKDLLAQQDILAMPFPEEYGGLGSSEVTILMVIEELARACATTSLILCVQQLGALPILLAGTDDQKRQLDPPARQRRVARRLRAHRARLRLRRGRHAHPRRARRRPLRAQRPQALDHQRRHRRRLHRLRQAPTRRPAHAASPRSSSRTDCPGFHVGKLEHKLGIRGSPTGELRLRGLRVPGRNRLGEEGDGFQIAHAHARPHPARHRRAGAWASPRARSTSPCDYIEAARAVRQADRRATRACSSCWPTWRSQIEAARAAGLPASARWSTSGDAARRAAACRRMAKCFASDMAMQVTTDAVQLLGGYGYIKEFPVERMMRDAKITQIYEGTNQIQRIVIARNLQKRQS